MEVEFVDSFQGSAIEWPLNVAYSVVNFKVPAFQVPVPQSLCLRPTGESVVEPSTRGILHRKTGWWQRKL